MIDELEKFQREIFQGWEVNYNSLVEVISGLTQEQLALHLDPDLRSLGKITTHIISARTRWSAW
jgi:hypothetical protein